MKLVMVYIYYGPSNNTGNLIPQTNTRMISRSVDHVNTPGHQWSQNSISGEEEVNVFLYHILKNVAEREHGMDNTKPIMTARNMCKSRGHIRCSWQET
jgi:hypothetical protein